MYECMYVCMYVCVYVLCWGTIYGTRLEITISQHADAKQLSPPPKQSQQWPIIISLTKVMLG